MTSPRIEVISGVQMIVIEDTTSDGLAYIRAIPMEAIASWSELLGYEDPADALDAILAVQDNGEPAPDPETGDNAWSATYRALSAAQQAARAAEYAAVEEGRSADPRSPRLRSALAKAEKVDEVAQARANTRARLGVPEPGQASVVATRRAAPGLDGTTGLPEQASAVAELHTLLREEYAETVRAMRTKFLETISPREATSNGS